MDNLPVPAPEALAHSQALKQAIADDIVAAGGWISFARFMEQVLYRPAMGYYAAGARKFGAAGDFVTSPEISGLFGQALAHQVAQVLAASAPEVLEVGAGSGRLAADLLLELERLGSLPERYAILDLSADLRERQQQTIAALAPHLLSRVEWLDRLPARFSGVVVANELLDALPVGLRLSLVSHSRGGLVADLLCIENFDGLIVAPEIRVDLRFIGNLRQLGHIDM